jgi:hypothetical protein
MKAVGGSRARRVHRVLVEEVVVLMLPGDLPDVNAGPIRQRAPVENDSAVAGD